MWPLWFPFLEDSDQIDSLRVYQKWGFLIVLSDSLHFDLSLSHQMTCSTISIVNTFLPYFFMINRHAQLCLLVGRKGGHLWVDHRT